MSWERTVDRAWPKQGIPSRRPASSANRHYSAKACIDLAALCNADQSLTQHRAARLMGAAATWRWFAKLAARADVFRAMQTAEERIAPGPSLPNSFETHPFDFHIE